jgi:2-polyprenyl-3-methyl-5-hydroxy-6-metoxy-1,4-benzoquinol methylase
MKMTATEQPTLDIQKKYWDDKWDWSRVQYPHDWALRRGDKMLAYLRSLGLQRPNILDLGCGTGWFANQLAQLGPTTGIDLSEAAIAQARLQFPQVAFESGNLFEMSLPEQHFDVVVSQEVIAHVADQAGYVDRAARALRPQGYLLVTTPNRFVNDRMEWPAQPPGHIEQWLSRRTLLRLLHPHFQVLRATTVVPIGHRGILRLVNSAKLNQILEWFVMPKRLEALKEWAGFGWTLIILAQKKSRTRSLSSVTSAGATSGTILKAAGAIPSPS